MLQTHNYGMSLSSFSAREFSFYFQFQSHHHIIHWREIRNHVSYEELWNAVSMSSWVVIRMHPLPNRHPFNVEIEFQCWNRIQIHVLIFTNLHLNSDAYNTLFPLSERALWIVNHVRLVVWMGDKFELSSVGHIFNLKTGHFKQNPF